MGHAGAAEKAPFLGRDRALVAYGERGQDPRGRGGAKHRVEAFAHGFSHLLYPIQGRISPPQQALLAALAHVAGRTDAALEKPRFVVEPVRIEVAVRTAQAHGEHPALARMHRSGEERGLGLRLRAGLQAAVPPQEDAARHALAVRSRLELELKAHPALTLRRQRGPHAHDLDIAPFELRREPLAHAQLSAIRGPEKPGAERDDRY